MIVIKETIENIGLSPEHKRLHYRLKNACAEMEMSIFHLHIHSIYIF